MNILILGSGGREHALAWKLKNDCGRAIPIIGYNGGVKKCIEFLSYDLKTIKNYCKDSGVELIVVGPEIYLAEGIVNYFFDTNIKVFGPDGRASKLESSKVWAKGFMKKHGVKTANFLMSDDSSIDEYISANNGDLVVKYDGLASGKGVFVCNNIDEVYSAIKTIRIRYGNESKFLLEEKLSGSELSIMGITDGKTIKLLPSSQDHKQLHDNDIGPNTGGMGAFCPVPQCDQVLLDKIYDSIIEPTIHGIKSEKFNYRGFIYFGIMVTDNGPYLLEYNVRLGDPEAEVVLPALKSNLLELILACFDNSLEKHDTLFNDGSFIDVVLADKGYPNSPKGGYLISGLDKISNDTLIFHAGTTNFKNKIFTSGAGRVLNVVANAPTLPAVINKVYCEINCIEFNDMYYRKDIGSRKWIK